ncbi:FAD-binding protein [Deinococcus sp. Arct2-2]|uniref:FAD-binding protein n=1 Tax=Deinococcus sp. Arct2-2 TaxID=2568653 RepID=UPI0010A327F7|nr:FAD-binding protein [Deinococcus sp. Arct2-2]THF69898.1 FAD-binding protein [Deinococcus sp. Arct2-2]THF69918.1 FAD-binding protein [Deinococcus sp. Arct2-2]
MTKQTNWGGNYTYRAARWHHPHTVEEVQDVVRRSAQVRVLGTRHSFNGIADTPEDLISLKHLNRVLALDEGQQTVTVEGGVRYGELCRYLDERGWALHNLASLPHLSVAGACATGTHGSGNRSPGLAAAVTAMSLVTAGGHVTTVSREQEGASFEGMVVGLGALGVVTSLTLKVEPSYLMRQDVYEHLPLTQLIQRFDQITGSAESVSLFTDWREPHVQQVWLKRRVSPQDTFKPDAEWFGATLAQRHLHPIHHLSAAPCNQQLGIPGPWFDRLPHFRAAHTPSSGQEVQSEYVLPRTHAPAALYALSALGKRLAPVLLISEVRTISADELWLSPCYHQDSVSVHFTWHPDERAVRALLPEIERELAPFGPRPHWGKVFTLPPARLEHLYPRLPDFRRLVTTWDPGGKFRNDFLNAYVFGNSCK